MSINKYSISQEDVCIWFKSHLEGHSRIELMCSLFDICLPLELRFLGTYLEYAAGKHHAHMQKWEKDANNPTSFLVTDLSDAIIRRRLCLFLTLLHSHNKSIATKLFDILSLYENLASLIKMSSSSAYNATHVDQHDDEKEIRSESEVDCHSTSWNEFKLLLTLSSLHPAFSFNQRLIIREKLEQFISLTDPSVILGKTCETKQCEVKIDNEQLPSQPNTPQLSETSLQENPLVLANDTTKVKVLSIPGNVQKQGLLPTPMLQIHELHFPCYIPVPGSFSHHPGQAILIPSSSLAVINQQEQMLCAQSAPNVPLNINNNSQYNTQNVSFHKVDTTNSISHPLSSQQDVISNNQFSSFHDDLISKRSDDITMKQPVLLQQNHISPFQIINNNFHHNTHKLFPTVEVHNNWGNKSLGEKPHDINQQKRRTERNSRGSVNDLRGSSSNLDLLSQRSFSDTDVCETRNNNINVVVPSRTVLPDTTTLSPNIINQNTNVTDYTISYKSKLICSPYTHADGNLLESNQPRAVLLPKQLTQLNNIQAIESTSQLIAPLNLHKQMNNVTHSVSDVTTSMLSASYSNKETSVSTMSKHQSPQVYISADKQTLPTGINGGYLQNPVNHDRYHNNTTITLTENHKRMATNTNQLFAETNIHKISPISIQVHRKFVSTNNNHILSPAGGGKFSNDCFESPATSPAHSPRRSPYSSPSTSPMSHRKDYANSKHVDAYSSASNWLKSLRLHKYSLKFEGYTFQMMKDLTDEGLAELISTKGAQSKFKQNVEQLVRRGFKEFGCAENLSANEANGNSPVYHVSPPRDGSPSNKIKDADMAMSNDVQSFLLSPVVNPHHDAVHNYQSTCNVYKKEINEIHTHPVKGKVQESSQLVRSSVFSEDIPGHLISDPCINDDTYDEVLTCRNQHSSLPTCYNCGAKGHYGHQCIEETMEAQTYSRYAFQLDFSRRDSFKNTEAKVGSASISSR